MTHERTIQILSQKLAQAEANHAYAVALYEESQERERLLEKERAELRERLAELEARKKEAGAE